VGAGSPIKRPLSRGETYPVRVEVWGQACKHAFSGEGDVVSRISLLLLSDRCSLTSLFLLSIYEMGDVVENLHFYFGQCFDRRKSCFANSE
jgi:hypothetical protein